MDNPRQTVLPSQRLWSKDFILINLANLFIFSGFQMLMPTLPVYAKHLGGSEAVAGMVIAVFAVSSVLIRPFAGRATDQYGRKGIFFLGLLIFILSVLSYSWVPGVGFLLLARFIHGFGWGSSNTAISTVATDVIPENKLGEGMGFFGLTANLSMALAPALGIYIMTTYTFSSLFLTAAMLPSIGLVLALFITYNKPNPDQARPEGSLLERSALRPTLIIFFVTMTYGAVVSFLALYAASLNIPNIGPFFTVYALTLLVSRPIFGRLSDKKGFDIVMLPGILCVLATMLILFSAHTMPMFLLAGFVYGVGLGAVQPTLQSMAVKHVPPFRRGAANGTYSTGFDLGIGLGSALWGLLAQAYGYNMLYLWASVPALIALVIYFAFGRTKPTPTLDTR